VVAVGRRPYPEVLKWFLAAGAFLVALLAAIAITGLISGLGTGWGPLFILVSVITAGAVAVAVLIAANSTADAIRIKFLVQIHRRLAHRQSLVAALAKDLERAVALADAGDDAYKDVLIQMRSSLAAAPDSDAEWKHCRQMVDQTSASGVASAAADARAEVKDALVTITRQLVELEEQANPPKRRVRPVGD
jgi:hypothetical protein